MPITVPYEIPSIASNEFVRPSSYDKVEHADLPKVQEGFVLQDVETVEELDSVMEKLSAAQMEYSTFNQAKVDHIVNSAVAHFVKNAERLAIMAHEETGMGNVPHKTVKNMFATEYVNKWYANTKTCGVISRDEKNNTDIVACPMGVIAAVIPTTNPTSTVAFKALCALKTRNAIIVGPHPRAKKSTFEALRIMIEGAVAAGCPPGIAACMSQPSIDKTGALMKHEKTSIILATGGPGMVKAAYSSGKPAIGVGPGNVPVVVDEFANLLECAQNVVASKNFDNGVICSSEQCVIADEKVYEELKKEFQAAGAHFLNEEEAKKVGELLFKEGGMLNADVVGQSPQKLAQMANLTVPDTVTLLIGEFDDIQTSPFAKEKLSPVLGFTKRKGIEALFEAAVAVLKLGGEGHTACYYTNQVTASNRINMFAERVVVTRCLINQPSAPGGIGGIYNFGIAPSMTLGCGTYGGNYLSDNVGPMHLLNFKRVVRCANDHSMVLGNLDMIVPQNVSDRCAMEIILLIMTIIVRDSNIIELYPQLGQIFSDCQDYMKGTGDVAKLADAVRYFKIHGLYDLGHSQLGLETACIEFNIPGGNLYPILFPDVAQKMENVSWDNLKLLNDTNISNLEDALKVIKSLQEKCNMPLCMVPSTVERMKKGGLAAMVNKLL